MSTKTNIYNNVAINRSKFREFIHILTESQLINANAATTPSRDGFVWSNEDGTVAIISNTFPYLYENDVNANLIIKGEQETVNHISNLMLQSFGMKELDYVAENVEYHTELNPAVWVKDGNNYTVIPEVRKTLLEAAEEFAEFVGLENIPSVKRKDITLTGSSANYNWTEASDVDLHILVNTESVAKEYKEAIVELFDAKRKLWNETHDIRVKNFPVEFYVQDDADTYQSTGVYSLLNEEWLEKPTYNPPDVDEDAVKQKYNSMLSDIQVALKSNKITTVERAFEKIMNIRKAGLAKGGEFAVENIVFKKLRADGWIEKLADHKINTFDATLSVEEEEICKRI